MRAATAAALLLVSAVLAAPAYARGGRALQQEPPPTEFNELDSETEALFADYTLLTAGTGQCNLPKLP
jgi:hypothetical protein